jgi:uncharacterized Fe-S cluster protein YjdI
VSQDDVREEAATSAPPDERARNVAPADLTRVYEDERIRVSWYAGRCIHSGACIRAQPSVFDPRRRPWIDLTAGDADAIATAVVRCPTGALEYQRLDGAPGEQPPEHPTVVPVRNGPLFVRGDIEVKDEMGKIIRRGTRLALCRCGRSAHLPFCDNTHRAIGFRTEA